MFDIYFGWQKASKCKKLMKLVRCRLKLLKNKRSTTAKLLREDLAKVIELGYEETALKWAGQLVEEEKMMAVYDKVDQYCEFVKFRLPYIRRHRDCPDDINEAISSLMFASARCAGLPELAAVRKLFRKRYGHGFETASVELLPGNLVNREIREILRMKSVSDDMKYRLIDEIAGEYCCRPQPEILELECFPRVQTETEGKPIQVVDPSIGIIGSNSLSSHRPNYVHPKLPEYEDVAAQLMDLKMEHLLHKHLLGAIAKNETYVIH
ncbi:uncharacterized protein LOC120185779 [Hibiscus syriacus]|uniref:uncharacterized protein LOC120185779 n=1 Tax=Hibiscus syriacus TaxID=106335 RepID=UPI001922E120|nr:uncharacterized protein LOC120185779 [Hibiscus syriacus]